MNKTLDINIRVATVWEEKIQGLSTNFSRPILVTFYHVILMMVILESNSFAWLEIKQNNMADLNKGLQMK